MGLNFDRIDPDMNRKMLVESIIERLGLLKHRISTYNQAGLFDIDNFSEDFFQRLLNLVFGYNLINVNTVEKKNFPAIDLGDVGQKVAFQITADSSKAKINETIKLFIEKGLYKKYTHLQILVLKNKTNFRENNFNTDSKFNFDHSKDIFDIDDLVTLIRQKSVPELELVHKFLTEELVDKSEKEQTKTIAREVETIMDLIQLLSLYDGKIDDTINESPDPEKKIYKRFKDYSEFLVNEIQELLPKYANARMEAIDKMGLDTLSTKHIVLYLKAKSDAVLIESKGDPKLALITLTNYFESKLGEGGKTYEYNAIRYYLIQEIINCNVFPNDPAKT